MDSPNKSRFARQSVSDLGIDTPENFALGSTELVEVYPDDRNFDLFELLEKLRETGSGLGMEQGDLDWVCENSVEHQDDDGYPEWHISVPLSLGQVQDPVALVAAAAMLAGIRCTFMSTTVYHVVNLDDSVQD